MFSKHLLKVIFGFCAVILLGLISLVVLNSFKEDDTATEKAQPPVKTEPCCVSTKVPQKAPVKKSTPSTSVKAGI